jgi:hypothetical protein
MSQMSQHKSVNPLIKMAISKISTLTEIGMFYIIDIHLGALKMASLVDGILHTTRFSERFCDLKMLLQRII